MSEFKQANRLLKALLSRLPVDDVPDGLEVLCLAVLVLEATKSLASSHSHVTTS
jgi:hypothetical protein